MKFDDFIQTKTKYHAYILGLLWADGYIRKPESKRYGIRLGIVLKDYLVIDPIFDIIGKWPSNIEYPKNKQPVMRIEANNKQFHNFLIKNDYITKSISCPTKILSHIPQNLQHYWWRGYFDGDGCCTNKITSISGDYLTDWSSVEQMLSTLDIKYEIRKRSSIKSSNSAVRFWRKCDIINWKNYLYPNGYDFGFKRKYDKLNQIKYSRLTKFAI